MTPKTSDGRGALPAALELRLAALETGDQCGEDFDAASLLWLMLLGVALPAALLLIGWWG